MKKVLLAAGAFAALAMALPAAAQPYYGGRDGVHQRFQQVERRIERGAERGLLNRREVVGLRHDFRQLVRLDAHYRRDGLNRWEFQDLNRRIDHLQARIRFERRDDDRRWDGDRRWDRDDDWRDDRRHDRRGDRRGRDGRYD